jgi:hypothetical protein
VPARSPASDEPLRLVHHHPGRLRARAQVFLHAKPSDPAVVAARAAVRTITDAGCFSHNPKTGSILIEYPPSSIEPDELLLHISAQVGLHGVLVDPSDHVHRAELVNLVLDTIAGLNSTVQELTEGRADLRELLPVALALTSFASFLLNPDHRRLPRWDSALWWAYRVFLHWHAREIEARTAPGVTRSRPEPFGLGPY